ncbi:MAG: hypothetical protein JW913_09460 [Chitinispirillaceae bacterium]|nr:hypothetical protein [Chitinispirillaceae bacterium]
MLTVKHTLFSLLLCSIIAAQTYDVSFEEKSEHNNWGTAWGTIYVVENDLITLAVVPKLGGRVMQYDLGTHPSIYVDSDVIGQAPTSGYTLIGGFRVLPSPQDDFGWPSPPELDINPYTCEVRVNNGDSAVIYLESEIVDNEDYKYEKHQGLQFKRLLTLYKASTRVKVEMTMINTSGTMLNHGIWDITQNICSNNDSVDTNNIWVYFKLNPSSTMNNGYVEYNQSDGNEASQWKPDIAPGIMGVQFQQKTGKIGADCNAGWICYVDRLDGYAYVKTFTYEQGKTYPDNGASVQVYTYSDPSTPTAEVEVHGPLTDLGQNDSVKLVENWYAARSFGPVLDVNSTGLITKHLEVKTTDDTMVNATGTFGLFYPGKVKVSFVKATGETIAVVDSMTVIPTDSLSMDKDYTVPQDAAALQLMAYNQDGDRIGLLDSGSILTVGNNNRTARSTDTDKKFTFSRKSTTFVIGIPYEGNFSVDLFTIGGKLISQISGHAPATRHINIPGSSSNVYITRIRCNGIAEKRTITFTRNN